MQPVFEMLMKYSRDLNRIGSGNIRITKKNSAVQISLPGSVIKCDYLSPWLNGNIKYGVITDRHRIQYINIVNDLYASYAEDDSSLYFEVIDGVVKIYRVSPDKKSKILINEINLVPIKGWLWTKLICI